MQEPPRPRRRRGRRRPAPRPRPTQAPAKPQPPRERGAAGDRRAAGERRAERSKPERARAGRARRARGRDRPAEGERSGSAAVILFDRREGEPDLTGATAVFEGYFDPETAERRQAGEGVPRLRVGNERIWGLECWWRADPTGAGVTPEDHEAVENAKRLLRGLLRDARRTGAFARRPVP